MQIRGTLKSVDQYLNIKLDNAEAVDELRWPHLVCFCVYMPRDEWRERGREMQERKRERENHAQRGYRANA